MDSFTEDLWSIILVRLPLNNITTCKLVCKQWKSIIESPYFRNLFMSLPQNSHSSSWSLLFRYDDRTDVEVHYGCERSLGSHILSFLKDKFGTHKDQYCVWSYNDVGLLLIREVTNHNKKQPFYIANPVSQECIELPYHHKKCLYPSGIVTRTENGVVLGYKVVLFDIFRYSKTELRFLIYSSETGLWSLKTIYLPFSLPYQYNLRCVSLNGNLYWLNRKSENEYFLVSHDFYATGTDSDRCRVMSFPDLEKHPKLRRACTISQGFLMYMNIVSETKDDMDKLKVWRLKSEEWQLVYEISADFIKPHFDHIPLTINNPFDAKTIYFWSKSQKSLLSYNLCNGKFVSLKHSSDGDIVSSVKCPRVKEYIKRSHFPSFVLPRWLHLN